MELLIGLLFPLVPLSAIWAVVRYGPIQNRWWKGENPLGFALFVGGIAFLAGFVGPIIVNPGANQGPLLGIFFTGPIGLIVGLLWGLLRAAQRASG